MTRGPLILFVITDAGPEAYGPFPTVQAQNQAADFFEGRGHKVILDRLMPPPPPDALERG